MANNKQVKEWQVKDKFPSDLAQEFSQLHPLLIQLLFNRGIKDKQSADYFLHPDYDRDLNDPFLFQDMEKAVKRVLEARDKKEKVVVYGDYDADGVCSASLLMTFLRQLEIDCQVYLPHRETEGYGLNMSAVDKFIKDGVGLLITVDCGTSNTEEIARAEEAGMNVIVIDHHHVPEQVPSSFAFLNCANEQDGYPFPYLAAVGMAYKFVQAVILYLQNKKQPFSSGQEKWLLDLVAIATVTDCVPLLGENRALVKYGLLVLNKSRRAGLRKLIEFSGLEKEIETWHLGFVIGPRLNAAGRIDHANGAYALLMASSEEEAEKLAQELQAANQERQQKTEMSVREAKKMVVDQLKAGRRILVAVNPQWELGLVGLIAGRLTEIYSRPALAVTFSQGKFKGSGRSVPGFDLISAVEKESRLLERFGGHKQACGFTVKDEESLQQFTDNLNEQAASLPEQSFVPSLSIDAEVGLEIIDYEFYKQLSKFSPFGQNNPVPRFLSRHLQVIGVEFVGAKNQHLRIMVSDEKGVIRKTIGFGLSENWGNLQMGDFIDLVYEVGLNDWQGRSELQLKIVDLKKVNN